MNGVSANCIGDSSEFGCGEVVTENCTFEKDLYCPEGKGLILGENEIFIDGNGFTLSGSSREDEAIINEGYDNVTIKNLNISGFCFGIFFKNVNNSNIEECSIGYGFGSGMWFYSSSNNYIENNDIREGRDGHGILFSNGAKNNFVSENTISTKNGVGIALSNSQENEFILNMVCNNKKSDFFFGEHSFENNRVNNTCESIEFNPPSNRSNMCASPCYSKKETGNNLNESLYSEPDTKTDNLKASRNPNTPYNCCVSVSNNSIIFYCGDSITQSCVFNTNITCESGIGLVVGAENVTIEGAGYTLDGVNPIGCSGWEEPMEDHVGVFNSGFDRVSVVDLEVANFCKGIYFKGKPSDPVSDCLIENCKVKNNGNPDSLTNDAGLFLAYMENSTIRNNTIKESQGGGKGCLDGGNGIFLYAGGNNQITENIVSANKKAGIFTKQKPKNNRISDNEVVDNGQGGIVLRCKLSSFFMIENNKVSGNKGPGIFVGGAGNTIKYNTVTDNKNGSIYTGDASFANGIRISRQADNTTLISNNVTRNDESDIYIKEGLVDIKGYNNSYDSSANFEEIKYNPQDRENVMGNKLMSFSSQGEIPEEKSEDSFFSSVKTPMMATILVFLIVLTMTHGFRRENTKWNRI
jgi:parallel beta-helix repeat protein